MGYQQRVIFDVETPVLLTTPEATQLAQPGCGYLPKSPRSLPQGEGITLPLDPPGLQRVR
jgi:hypothetical protein